MTGWNASEPLSMELRDFSNAICTGGVPRSSAALGLEVVRMIEAVDQSRERGGATVDVASLDPLSLVHARRQNDSELLSGN